MVAYLKSDLEFILAQIKISEAHAAATNAGTSIEESRQILLDLLPNSTVPWGLRTVDGIAQQPGSRAGILRRGRPANSRTCSIPLPG